MAELPWHTLLGFDLNKDGITGQFNTPANSLWFEGHFPDEPVLPGVSMLCMIEDLIRKANPGINITGLRRIRFRQLVHENELLNVKITWEEGSVSKTASFDITSKGNLISSGFIETDKPVGNLKP
jgi:3-hydroxyacyl-[acyl-carrier-protein] dehydratase